MLVVLVRVLQRVLLLNHQTHDHHLRGCLSLTQHACEPVSSVDVSVSLLPEGHMQLLKHLLLLLEHTLPTALLLLRHERLLLNLRDVL